MDKDQFPLLVGNYTFECFYQRGHFPNGLWQQSDTGAHHVAVCKCGRGVYGDSLQDAVERLKKSYCIVRDNEHWHWQDTPRFNVILGIDGTWVMGTITEPDLLSTIHIEGIIREILPIRSAGAMTWVEGYYCSQCTWEERFEPNSQSDSGVERERTGAHQCKDYPTREMQYFQLEHPANEIILCDYAGCDGVADHLDVDQYGHEYRHCATHRGADVHASPLPKRKVNPNLPYRSRPV